MDISVIIPVCNESDSIKELYKSLTAKLSSLHKEYEIIFIDDGSADESYKIIQEMHTSDTKVKGIKLRRNFGKSAALECGFDKAKGDLILTMDADLQDDPSEIDKFLNKINEGNDFVVGWKKKRHDPLYNVLASKIFNFVISLVFGWKIHDINCGFKCFKRIIVEEINLYGELHRFLPLLAFQKGFYCCEVPVLHHKRQHGKSKYGPGKFLRGFFDFISVFFLTRYTKKPGHFFGIFGILFFIAGTSICGFISYLRFTYGTILNRYPLLILGVLLIVVGLQLFSFGLLGEMITSSTSKTEKPYSIKDEFGI